MIDPLICLGSLNSKLEDRFMKREDVRPFQYIVKHNIYEFAEMSSVGKLGISSLACIGESIFITTGTELYEITIKDDSSFVSEQIAIPNLVDVHEISPIDNKLWLANTGLNELICYDPAIKKVVDRFFLPNKISDAVAEEYIGSYHCNQCFTDHNGDLLSLVHHVDGKQHIISLTSRVVNKLKKQGNGGVINARTGEVKLSGLSAPHSVRKLNDGTCIVCDSGKFELCHYDENWKLIKKTTTYGWGRGAAIGDKFIYIAISCTRKRYLSLLPNAKSFPNMILVYDISNFRQVARIDINCVEQINNIYIANEGLLLWIKHNKPKVEFHAAF